MTNDHTGRRTHSMYDVIVLGGMGSAAAYHLARRGRPNEPGRRGCPASSSWWIPYRFRGVRSLTDPSALVDDRRG